MLISAISSTNQAYGATPKPDMPATFEFATRDNAQERRFIHLHGWTGADAAYSIPLDALSSLWLFGDTFVGNIAGGRRQHPVMIHNSVGLEDLKTGVIRFFLRRSQGKPISEFLPRGDDATYYWPGDGIYVNGKLVVFCKRIIDLPGGEPFNFHWLSDNLIVISNPLLDPPFWKRKHLPLPGSEAMVHLGTACIADGDYVYVYGTRDDAAEPEKHPGVIARIPRAALAGGDLDAFEYWCHKVEPDGQILENGIWSTVPTNTLTMFDDAAPEMSVSRITGLPGYWAVYTPNGLSPNIFIRYAERPEGPWSEPLQVYSAPEAQGNPGLLCYGAKNHAEMSFAPCTLEITYCLNPGAIEKHIEQPFAYFPRAVRVMLKPKQQSTKQ